jgi:hypothetical protein
MLEFLGSGQRCAERVVQGTLSAKCHGRSLALPVISSMHASGHQSGRTPVNRSVGIRFPRLGIGGYLLWSPTTADSLFLQQHLDQPFYDGCAADRGLALLVRSYRDGWGGENSRLPQAWELACPAIQCAALAKTLSPTRPILKSRAKKIPAVGTCEDFCCCV